ncbi:glycosyltransferase [Thiolapillus sp.]
MSKVITPPDLSSPFKDVGLPLPCRPISFVVVRFSDEYLTNFALSEAAGSTLNETIVVDNTGNLFFPNLARAMQYGIDKAQNDLIVVVHEDVLLPNGWQALFEFSLKNLEAHDRNWLLLSSVGWSEEGEIVGHWKDPRNFLDSFSGNRGGYEPVASCDEQILVFHKNRLLDLDLNLPGIHHIGRDLPKTSGYQGVYAIDAPTIHKYADARGNPIEAATASEKIRDRSSLTYLADRTVCNDYIKKKWPDLEVKDYRPFDFTLPFGGKEKLGQLDSPIIFLGRGGGGTRLLGGIGKDAGVFLGNKLNESMDSEEMILPIYTGIVEKYQTFTDWQKQQIVPRIRCAAASMIQDLDADKLWGFKLPESMLMLPELKEAFPNARYIYLVRDPLKTCLRRTHMTARLDNHIGRITLPLAYDWVGRNRASILQDMPEKHMAYTTLHQMSIADEFLDSLGAQQKYVLRFESIMDNPAGVINDVCDWLGVTPSGHSVITNVDSSRANASSLLVKPSLAMEIGEVLYHLRDRLGYGQSAGESDGDAPVNSGLKGQNLVVVLGMHRSGTSALSAFLHAHGVDFGENLLAAQEDNPKGFFEDRDIYEFNEELLNILGYEWHSISSIDPKELASPALNPFVERAQSLLCSKISDRLIYGMKDPRLSRLLPFWKKIFDQLGLNVHYFLSLRNPYDVYLSLRRRDNFDAEKALRIWIRYYLDLINDGDIISNATIIDYDELLDSPSVQEQKIRKRLQQIGMKAEGGGNASCCLDLSLRHGVREEKSSSGNIAESQLANVIYDLLKEVSMAASPREVLLSGMAEIASEVNQVELVFNRIERENRLKELYRCSEGIESTIQNIDELRLQYNQLREENRDLKLDIKQHKVMAAEEAAELLLSYQKDIHGSISWRVTKPLRLAKSGYDSLLMTATPALAVIKRIGLYRSAKYAVKVLASEGPSGLLRRVRFAETNNAREIDYQQWIADFDSITTESKKRFAREIDSFSFRPLISIVMPVYDPPVELLIQAIESVRKQIYPDWELCIADDCSANEQIRVIIKSYAEKDKRIKYVFRKENGHISKASNSALQLATGDFVALMDHDDLLSEHALFWVAHAVQENPEGKLFYSDEDKIDLQGIRHDPYFKCDWNLDLFYSHNMFSHLGVYDASLLGDTGGFREGLEGSQDYDLALRCIEKVEDSQIIHIPRVLYHWRVMPGSTALDASEKPYAMIAGERAINDHFARTGVEAECRLLGFGYRVKYRIQADPLVSVIIPTRDEVDILRTCLDSIYEKTTYKNYEIIIIDNGSRCEETQEYLLELQQTQGIKIIRDDGEFNFSSLNNKGVAAASGEIVALVNNDVEVISPGWMTEMVSQACRPEIGAVGCRLIYPDNTLQHAGIILGLGGLAAYSHRCIPKESPGYFGRAMLLQSISAVTAACLFVRRNVYMEVGGMDEDNLAVAYNDVDFCLRLREAGYRNIFTPYAELTHFESKSRGLEDTPEKQERLRKEYAYMRNRWGELLDRDPAYNPNLTLDREDFSLSATPRIPHIL